MIPASILAPLVDRLWAKDEFNLTLFDKCFPFHEGDDRRDGYTCAYTLGIHLHASLKASEVEAMLDEGAIEPHHLTPDKLGINQHVAHSLLQFYAGVSKLWEEHRARMKKIKGTASDRLMPSDLSDA